MITDEELLAISVTTMEVFCCVCEMGRNLQNEAEQAGYDAQEAALD
jgi:hypothetical protein